MRDKRLQFPTPGCQRFYQRTCQHIHLVLFRRLKARHLHFNEPAAGNGIILLKKHMDAQNLKFQRDVSALQGLIPAVLITIHLAKVKASNGATPARGETSTL